MASSSFNLLSIALDNVNFKAVRGTINQSFGISVELDEAETRVVSDEATAIRASPLLDVDDEDRVSPFFRPFSAHFLARSTIVYNVRMKTAIERFYKIVKKTSTCWLWIGWRNTNKSTGISYGMFRFDGKPRTAHRVSWRIHKGDIPNGMCVLHTCDNGICVNPEHLYLGTYLDNNRDREKRGRGKHPRGEGHVLSKLNSKNVLSIRRSYSSGNTSQHILAKKFKVSRSLIQQIVTGKCWIHV